MSSPQQTFTPRVILQLLLFVIVVPFLPILIAWRWGWWEAWVYALISVLGFAVSRALAARRHPDLLAERARFADHADAKVEKSAYRRKTQRILIYGVLNDFCSSTWCRYRRY